MNPNNWLKEGKKAAICFTIDDLHPAQKIIHGYDAGGDLDTGVFRYLNWLFDRHPQLKVTFFTTADWREKSPIPTRKLLSKIPWLRDQFYLASIQKKGTFRLDKFPEFVKFYNQHPNIEIGLHGLHHIHKGLNIPVEFQDESVVKIDLILKEMISIFENSNLKYVKGFTPPAWNASDNLQNALINNGIEFLASARDLNTPISIDAKNSMSGLRNVSIVYPEWIQNNKLLHFPTNFQVTSKYERAKEIVEIGGLLSIKGHIIEELHGFKTIDAINKSYMEKLDKVFCQLEDIYGDDLWFTSMNEITQNLKTTK
ncbi:MAG: DUF2334 domain-containing protein [Weeksellaceae bacterium]|nr:DUF2334 domain-containing protein [Weeksellaceae bacterium]